VPEIRTVEKPHQLDAILSRSRECPVWIFKHSLACGISFDALEAFESFAAGSAAAGTELFLVEIQRSRPLSDEIARATGVSHKSPQVLLVIDGEVVWHTSHWDIRTGRLEAAMRGGPASSSGSD
jgi:bacillithiol system protein YtxJ